MRLLAFSNKSEERKESGDAVAWAHLDSSWGELIELIEPGRTWVFPLVAVLFDLGLGVG